MSIALEAYAMQAKDTAMLAWATEIKLRAERKAGEMLKDTPVNTGVRGQIQRHLSGGNSRVPPDNPTPTLSDSSISKRQSSHWQKIAE